MTRFEVLRDDLSTTRIREEDMPPLADGHIRLKVDAFAFTANNITYGVAGERIGYWRFFPAPDAWGVLPVWGFADIVESRVDGLEVGARVFGYLPPATTVDMKPGRVGPGRVGKGGFTDVSEHRSALPATYNGYRFAPATSSREEAERMLLFPLHVTSWSLWDSFREAGWHGGEQVVTLSASSKTALGFGHALRADADAPTSIGVTSSSRVETVAGMDLYDEVMGYDDVGTLPNVPTLVVDMSGNTTVLNALADRLGDDLRFISRVGITHWETAGDETSKANNRVREASKMFFAPGHISDRIAQWGAGEFNARTTAFLSDAARASRDWLEVRDVEGLEGLKAVYDGVLQGQRPASEGLVVRM